MSSATTADESAAPPVPADAARARRLTALAVSLAAALLVPSLWLRGLWPPDEARYADVARHMRAAGEFVVPQLHGELYGEKPPLFFWLIAALDAGGVSLDVAPRLVSVAAALGTVALLPGIGRAVGLAPAVAARAALLLVTTPLFLVYAQMGLTDPLFSFLVSAAIAAKLARVGRRGAAARLLVLTEGAVLAAGLLTKGPVVLLFAGGLRLGALLGGPGSPGRPARDDAWVLACAAGGACAWLAAAAQAAGVEYARAIALGQALQRVTGDAPHLRPPGFLLLALLLGAAPWSLFGIAALRPARRERRRIARASAAPLLGWLGLPLVLLSLIRSQQPHYLLPALSALALLVAPALEAPAWLRSTLRILALVPALLFAALGAAPAAILGATRVGERVAGLEGDLFLRGLCAALAAALCAFALTPSRDPSRSASWRAGAGAALIFLAALLAVWRADAWIVPRALLSSPALADAHRLASPAHLRSLVRVSTGREDVEVVDDSFLSAMQGDPSAIALVWEKDLSRGAAASGRWERIGSGRVRGRMLVAIRRGRQDEASADQPPARFVRYPRASSSASSTSQ